MTPERLEQILREIAARHEFNNLIGDELLGALKQQDDMRDTQIHRILNDTQNSQRVVRRKTYTATIRIRDGSVVAEREHVYFVPANHRHGNQFIGTNTISTESYKSMRGARKMAVFLRRRLLDNARAEVVKATEDANVSAVQRKLGERAARGLAKYGVTTERGDLSVVEWLNHLQEELLDGAVYVERLMKEVRNEDAH